MCEQERKITREHVIPIWATDVLTELSPLTPALGSPEAARAVVRQGDIVWYSQAIDVVVKGLCHPCNSGQEGTAPPLLERLIRGEALQLTSDDQVAVATWAYAKSLSLGFLDPMTREFGSALRGFHRRRRPPLQSQAWLGRFDRESTWPDLPAFIRVGRIELQRGGHDFAAAFTVIVMANVVLAVCRWLDEGVVAFDSLAGILPMDALTSVWPVKSAKVLWPPEVSVTYRDLLASDVHGGSPAPPSAQ
jgi:hypothetical protein